MTAADAIAALIRAALAETMRRPLVIGLCGAQGSGKSTVAAALVDRLGGQGMAAATLSIDDLYLTRADRLALAARVHPLLATRGVPGTHDPALGLAVFAALDRGEAVRLPRFDKARDDRTLETASPSLDRADVVIFEGWCVGARPQAAADLALPVNALERDGDPDGRWRAFVNAAVGSDAYQALFARIDRLVLLAAPDAAWVYAWRQQQEDDLRIRVGAAPGVMTPAEVDRFVALDERLTRHILAEMPGRADLVIDLAPDRSVLRVTWRGAAVDSGGGLD